MNILTDLLLQKQQPTREKKQQKGIQIKTEREIGIMRQSAKIVATVLKEIMAMVEPGMTTADLDAYAEKRIREMDAIPSFKGLYGFPASICSSINDEAVHGIPNRKKVIPGSTIAMISFKTVATILADWRMMPISRSVLIWIPFCCFFSRVGCCFCKSKSVRMFIS